MTFIDVILPLPLAKTFTYAVPNNFGNICVGSRVIVQFGAKKIYTAIVYKKHLNQPKKYDFKTVLDVLDENPIVNNFQLKLWFWISEYYACNIGDVMKAALPAGLKLSSETVIIGLNKCIEVNNVSNNEYLILEALEQQNKLSLLEISKIIDQKNIFPTINSLIEKKYILLQEELSERYKPKFLRKVNFLLKKNNINELYKSLSKAPKQKEIIRSYFTLIDGLKTNDISVPELLNHSNASHQALNSLVKKNIISIEDKIINRIDYLNIEKQNLKNLTNPQKISYDQIRNQFNSKDVVLFHGVTSSGKTEIYVKLIQEQIERSNQVLYLIPEIALTTQLISRLRKYFGDKIGVYHSRFNQNERVEVWNEVLSGNRFPIILGARSSLFLPFKNLGLVIVDEEHESSFKQINPSPRYNARDCAIVLAKQHNAKTLLGSATPSLESYYNVKTNKYGYVELNKRFGDIEMPQIEIVDLKKLKYKKKMNGSFSPDLINEINYNLEKGKQVILFQNRRGFAPVLECQSCAWTARCKSCDVTLTYHKKISLLKCHYCGYSEIPLKKCKSCSSSNLLIKGVGTEKIEEEVKTLFPKYSVSRMDLDTTSKKNAHHEIINSFENKYIDILIGTQMISKGLDFDNVGIVGILNADNLLNFPDFRSHERAFQLMTQVSGRAGRKKDRGKVIIQTYSINHPIIKLVKENNFHEMFVHESKEREIFKYPPYVKIIKITISHKDYKIVNLASKDLSKMLRKSYGLNVLGPEYPVVSRVKNKFLKNILLKIDKINSHKKIKEEIKFLISKIQNISSYKSVRVIVDVDPF